MANTLHKYSKTAAMTATGVVGDSPLFLIDYLLRFLRVMLLLAIWRMILAGKGAVSGMTLASVLTYTLIAEVFAEQLSCRTETVWAFWDGSISTRFIKPLGIFGQFAAEMFGRWGFHFGLFSLPLLLCAPLLGVNPLPASPVAFALFLVSLALAVSVGLALDFIFTALAIGLEFHPWALDRLRSAIGALLSGAMIPLALLPWGMGRLFDWLPFASMASAPLRIYTGTGDAARLLTLQAAWSVVLWPIAQGLWRRYRERMMGYGG